MNTEIDQSNLIQYHHAKLIRDVRYYAVTVEDVARAWASMFCHAEEFDNKTGAYGTYMVEAEELLRRAVERARGRRYGTDG